jgi:hypothetical protein
MSQSALTRSERLRRVIILCCNFARNLAYYRVGQAAPLKALLADAHPEASFWRQANANFIDMCVLEWCKLFGDKNGKHHWSSVVSDRAAFEAGLLAHLKMDATVFQLQVDAMRLYRDKFVAHLDSLHVMDIPMLDMAQASVWHLHEYLITSESGDVDLSGLPDTAPKFQFGYEQCVAESNRILTSRTQQ